jgi:hypothetical protein
VGWGFRKSKRLGPFRLSIGKRRVSGSVGTKRLRVGRSTSGRRWSSLRLPGGFSWRKTKGG